MSDLSNVRLIFKARKSFILAVKIFAKDSGIWSTERVKGRDTFCCPTLYRVPYPMIPLNKTKWIGVVSQVLIYIYVF